METPAKLTPEEQQVLQRFRWLRQTYRNARLTVYIQSQHGIDVEWSARERLSPSKPLNLAVDD